MAFPRTLRLIALMAVPLLLQCGDTGHPSGSVEHGPQMSPSQEILFEHFAEDASFGVLEGFYVTSTGEVWTYRVPRDSVIRAHTSEVFTEQQLQRRYGADRELVHTVDSTELARRWTMIMPASEGRIVTVPTGRLGDAWAKSVAYAFEGDTLYREVLLCRYDNHYSCNSSVEGEALCHWMFELGFLIRFSGMY